MGRSVLLLHHAFGAQTTHPARSRGVGLGLSWAWPRHIHLRCRVGMHEALCLESSAAPSAALIGLARWAATLRSKRTVTRWVVFPLWASFVRRVCVGSPLHIRMDCWLACVCGRSVGWWLRLSYCTMCALQSHWLLWPVARRCALCDGLMRVRRWARNVHLEWTFVLLGCVYARGVYPRASRLVREASRPGAICWFTDLLRLERAVGRFSALDSFLACGSTTGKFRAACSRAWLSFACVLFSPVFTETAERVVSRLGCPSGAQCVCVWCRGTRRNCAFVRIFCVACPRLPGWSCPNT
jgi:hypothetical protein